MQAAQGGDRQALDRLLRRHATRLHALCRRMMGSAADADDALQEGLIAVSKGVAGGRFDGRASFSTWSYRVTANACLDELRRRARRPDATPDDELDRAGGGRSISSPEGAVADRLDVEEALTRVPADFRAAVVLRDLCGLDYAEIAEVLAVPIGTVRSRIARGRAALVPHLGNPAPPAGRPTPYP